MSDPRVLVLHNRYRILGGEERAVDLHLAALVAAGVKHRALMRDSGQIGHARAAAGLLRGGAEPEEVARATRELGATVVHAHNLQPLLGPRALRAGRDAGARTVLHLHNFRLFCAIGVAFRRGEPCFRCHHGRTLPGLVLNCRGSLPQAAVYATALRRQLSQMLDVVDRFVTPSSYLAGQIVGLGVPAERVEALPHYLPEEGFADSSLAHRGSFALVVGRLSAEKGIELAIEAAAAAGVPLKVAGSGRGRPTCAPQRCAAAARWSSSVACRWTSCARCGARRRWCSCPRAATSRSGSWRSRRWPRAFRWSLPGPVRCRSWSATSAACRAETARPWRRGWPTSGPIPSAGAARATR